jgi:phytanoyl-CoA hydroxylase
MIMPTQMNNDYPLTEEQITSYRRNGFIQLTDVITGDDLTHLRTAVEEAVANEDIPDNSAKRDKSSYESIFIQKVNLWQRHAGVKEFVLSKRFGNLAARLSGFATRVWHDQALFKEPQTGSKTPWHQDSHYWPHREKGHQTSIWIALKDATVQNGCMSFIPGTQTLKNIEPVNLGNPQDLFAVAPQVKGIKPVTCPLAAGSVTFHNGLTFHYAGPNRTDGMREAMAVLYMPDGTTYSGRGHCVIEEGEFKVGERLNNWKFPLVSDVALPELNEVEETAASSR